jgi:asparagine N-glycosylation enzyme membrane subunit Stt3
MYMLIMIIGIVAVTYQIIIYNRSRNNVRFIQKTLGATSAQTIIITFLENVVILGISAIAGSCIALGAGKVICLVLEHTKGVTFFRIDKDIYIKVIIMMVISVVVSIISILLSGCHKKKQGSNRTVKITGNLMKKNFIINTATRLMRTNGIIVNILVRVFSFVMAVITVLCGIGIVTSYGNYKEQCSTPDCVNYMVDNVSTVPCIYYDSLHELIKIENGIRYTENSRVIPGCNEFNIADGHNHRWQCDRGGWCMNSELIALTFKGLCRRWREVVRVVAVVMISFMFVTGVLLYSGNMKKWQTAINIHIIPCK